MSRRRVLGLRAAAAACVAAVGLVWWPTPAGSQVDGGDAETGWWHRLSGESGSPSTAGGGAGAAPAAPPPTLPPGPAPFPTVPLGDDDPPAVPAPVPPPAPVPAGGLYVANDTFGPVAIAALRFPVGQVGDSTLTLRFADGAGGAGLPIVACPLLEGFQAVENGAWRDRPAHDCGRSTASGTFGADGTLRFQLPDAFQQAGQATLDVVLLPTPGDGTPFTAPFEAVAGDALEVRGPAPARSTPTTRQGFTPDPAAPAASFNRPGAAPGGAARPNPGALLPAPGSANDASASGTAGGGPVAEVPGVRAVAEIFDDRTWARWVATTLLGVLAVGMTAASSGRVPAFAGATARTEKGVGRFARHRDGPPPALT